MSCGLISAPSACVLSHTLRTSPMSSVVASRVNANAKVASTKPMARSNSDWSRVQRGPEVTAETYPAVRPAGLATARAVGTA